MGPWGIPVPVAIGLCLVAVRRFVLRQVVILSSCTFAFGCGVLLGGMGTQPDALTAIARSVPRCAIEAIVLEKAGSFGTLVGVTSIDCTNRSVSGDIGVAVADVIEDPGSRIEGEGWIIPLAGDASDQSMRRLGATARIRFRALETHEPTGPLHRSAANVREALANATSNVANGTGGLLRGLAIGDTSQIDAVTVEALRDSGLAHLLAVSGSNVAIVVGAAALAARNSSLRMRTAVAAGCLLLYVLVVGPEPSVLRAAAMGSLALIAVLSGRTTEPIAALGVASALVIVMRPEMVHSAGLHLSVAATAGIVLFGSPIGARLRLLPRPVALVLGATIGAQIAVAPVIIATFGELSLVAPFSNLLAAPAVPPATVLSLGAALSHAAWPPLGHAVMELAEPFGAWIVWVAETSAAAPFAAIEVPRPAGLIVGGPVAWLAVRAARRRVG